MKGTAKQVAWANEIKEKLIRTYNTVADMYEGEERAAVLALIERLNSVESASDIIGAYKFVSLNGNLEHDLRELSSNLKFMESRYRKIFVEGIYDKEN